MYTYLSHLVCSACKRTYPADARIQTCGCGSPLLVSYDLQKLKGHLRKEDLKTRPETLWRYHELLPIVSEESIVTLHETMTPIIPLFRSGLDMNIPGLLVKDEGVLPSGTFKARGAAVGISKAKELGVTALALPTNGNAGAAWALYAARAGIEATVAMPITAPIVPQKECIVAGAKLWLVDGTIADAGALIVEAGKIKGWYDVGTLKEPYRLEGKKTMGFEIAEQTQWNVPDVIVYPTGGGAGVIGIYKALRELQQIGWIGERLPRMVVAQAAGCAPLVRAYELGEKTSQLWENAATIAFGMRVPKPLGDFMILNIVEQTGGTAISVTDDDVRTERKKVAQQEGLHICPEGAAAFAAARRLRQSGWIKQDERVLVMNTGSGLKYADQIDDEGTEYFNVTRINE